MSRSICGESEGERHAGYYYFLVHLEVRSAGRCCCSGEQRGSSLTFKNDSTWPSLCRYGPAGILASCRATGMFPLDPLPSIMSSGHLIHCCPQSRASPGYQILSTTSRDTLLALCTYILPVQHQTMRR